MTFSPEFRLVAAACCWPPSELLRRSAVRTAASVSIDWERFLRIARRQHVAGLVWRGLGDARRGVPGEVRERLGKTAMAIAQTNLRGVAESHRIQTAFDEAGIPVVFLKGLTLGALAYGDIGLKYSCDIDILVRPKDVFEASAILASVGYCGNPPFPEVGSPFCRHWIKYGQEYLFTNSTNRMLVELHWRLTSNDAVLAGLSPFSDVQVVAVADGIQLRTLSNDELLLYLCTHGARHNWLRLHWLVDINALFAKMDESDIRRILVLARPLNADHCVAQAIILCDALFGLPQTASIAKSLLARPYQRLLNRLAVHYLSVGRDEVEAQRAVFGNLAVFASRYLLGRGVRHWLCEAKAQMFAPHDLLSNPKTADTPIYPVVRAVGWLMRAGRMRRPVLQLRPPH